MRCGGIVLCGGQSWRMGRPKAWLPFGGESMLARVVRLLREAVEPVVVVAAPGQDVPALPPEVAVIRDEIEGKGPLAGLAAGLAVLEATCDAAYLSACDTPLLRPAFVRRVVGLLRVTRFETANETIFAAVPRVDGFWHPLAAAYGIEILASVRERLARGQHRLTDLCLTGPTLCIEAAGLVCVDPDLVSLRNLNTPADYEEALRIAFASTSP